jgi:hypothetical protein
MRGGEENPHQRRSRTLRRLKLTVPLELIVERVDGAAAVLAANSSVSALLMASPVKLAPATDVWVNACVCGVPFQAAIEPFRLAKMNAADLPFPPFLSWTPDLGPLAKV